MVWQHVAADHLTSQVLLSPASRASASQPVCICQVLDLSWRLRGTPGPDFNYHAVQSGNVAEPSLLSFKAATTLVETGSLEGLHPL